MDLTEWLADAIATADWGQPAKAADDDRRIAQVLLDRLAAEDSPALLVARGDVEERVEWGVRYPSHPEPILARDEAAARHLAAGDYNAGPAFARSRTVRSWSLPDGTRVEVTGPWSEVGE